jgi:cyclohexadienyl dehydratase
VRLLLAFVLALLVDGAAAAPSPEVEGLLDLIEHRARLMPDVARWKWHAGRAVTDTAREAIVLEAATRQARASGLAPEGARAFVNAQMALSRAIQEAAFERWASAPPDGNGPDLLAELRPAISATTDAMLEALPRVLPLLPAEAHAVRTDLNRRLKPLGAEADVVEALTVSLLALHPAPLPTDPVARIRARGVLRVATTGDYAPFSALNAAGERVGIDIVLAELLAASLGVSVEFVPTSWPSLMADLAAGEFDIAMSGISRTTARARDGDFSAPYHVGGKTPVVRCADVEHLAGLDAIDREGVRAVVNPGGTNERFARATLRSASLRVFEDNTRIFTEIAEDRADVMFTDAIEVRLVTRRDPRLCAAMPGRTLTYQEKGFLLPRSTSGSLVRYVDLWLAQLRGSGELARIFDAHLAP